MVESLNRKYVCPAIAINSKLGKRLRLACLPLRGEGGFDGSKIRPLTYRRSGFRLIEDPAFVGTSKTDRVQKKKRQKKNGKESQQRLNGEMGEIAHLQGIPLPLCGIGTTS